MKKTITQLREMVGAVIAPSLVEKRDIALRDANTDALTGLANRAAFNLAEPGATKVRSAFILFDLNNFGRVNKELGHTEGDKVLQSFAEVFKRAAPALKVRAFRYGGDEFVIICKPGQALIVRDAIERRIKEREYEGFTVSISGSVGYSVAEADAQLQKRKTARKRAVLTW